MGVTLHYTIYRTAVTIHHTIYWTCVTIHHKIYWTGVTIHYTIYWTGVTIHHTIYWTGGTIHYMGWWEPGNKTLQRGRILLLVMFKKRVPDQEGRPAGQRQSRAGAEKRFLVLFRIIEQGQELL